MLLKYARKKVFYCQVRQQTTTQKYNEQSTRVGFFSEAHWSKCIIITVTAQNAVDQNFSDDCRRLSGLLSGRLKLAVIGRSSNP